MLNLTFDPWQLLERQQEHEETVHKMSMQHTEELQQQQEDHEEIITGQDSSPIELSHLMIIMLAHVAL